MGKLLRVLVVFILLFAIGSLVLGVMLFGKREVLKGRTALLEDYIIKLGPVIEDEPPAGPRSVEYPSRDVSPVENEVLDQPELSTFWDRYKAALELQTEAPVMMDLKSREDELRTYYLRDATGAISKDGRGFPITEGEGTMGSVLEALLDRAEQQYNRLIETRQQLKELREETTDVISELNERKRTLRQKLVKIDELNAEITQLKDEKRQLEIKVDELTEDKERLEGEVRDLQRQMAFLQEDLDTAEAEKEQLRKELDDCEGTSDTPQLPPEQQGGSGRVRPTDVEFTAGVKATVVSAREEWNFVVVEMNDTFLQEARGEDGTVYVGGIELLVRRPGQGGQFVTKIVLSSVWGGSGKLAIGRILDSWTQVPLQEGDVAFHQ